VAFNKTRYANENGWITLWTRTNVFELATKTKSWRTIRFVAGSQLGSETTTAFEDGLGADTNFAMQATGELIAPLV
jgi:hypothetical protein